MNIFRVARLVRAIAIWFKKAVADGQVSVVELAQLAMIIGNEIGIKAAFRIKYGDGGGDLDFDQDGDDPQKVIDESNQQLRDIGTVKDTGNV